MNVKFPKFIETRSANVVKLQTQSFLL